MHLLAGSLCIDAGDNNAVPDSVTTDLDGNPRFFDDPLTPDSGVGSPPIVTGGTKGIAQRRGDDEKRLRRAAGFINNLPLIRAAR